MRARYQEGSKTWEDVEFDIFADMENGVALYRGANKDPSNQVAYLPFDRLGFIVPSEE